MSKNADSVHIEHKHRFFTFENFLGTVYLKLTVTDWGLFWYIFYGSTPNQFFVNHTPEKTELLDDISLYVCVIFETQMGPVLCTKLLISRLIFLYFTVFSRTLVLLICNMLWSVLSLCLQTCSLEFAWIQLVIKSDILHRSNDYILFGGG